jgi:hypothetical protein
VSEVDLPDTGKSVASERDVTATKYPKRGQNHSRQNTIFAPRFNVIGRFKPARENISLFQKMKSGGHRPSLRP